MTIKEHLRAVRDYCSEHIGECITCKIYEFCDREENPPFSWVGIDEVEE